MSGEPAAAVATCAIAVSRDNYPDRCGFKAHIIGTLTYPAADGERKAARVGYCRRHAAEISRGRPATALDSRLDPEYPYLVSGTWEPDPEPTP